MSEQHLTVASPPVDRERTLYGDRELVASAILNLGMGGAAPVGGAQRARRSRLSRHRRGHAFRIASPGAPLQPSERINIFAPYGRHAAGTAMYGLGLALARALVELSRGSLWVEDFRRAAARSCSSSG